jgi:hypothetical protein
VSSYLFCLQDFCYPHLIFIMARLSHTSDFSFGQISVLLVLNVSSRLPKVQKLSLIYVMFVYIKDTDY